MVRLGMDNAHLCADALEKLLETQEARERPLLERGAQFLGTVGANAPFLGLTGTVLGILAAFRRMAEQGGSGGTEVMSAIAGALIATAAGLMVAIPAVVLYNLLKARIRKAMDALREIRALLLARSLQAVGQGNLLMAAASDGRRGRHHLHQHHAPGGRVPGAAHPGHDLLVPAGPPGNPGERAQGRQRRARRRPRPPGSPWTPPGNIFLDGVETDSASVAAALREKVAKDSTHQVLIAADHRLLYEDVVRLLDWVRGSGVRKYALKVARAE